MDYWKKYFFVLSHARASIALGKFSTQWNYNKNAQIVFPNDSTSIKRYYPSDLFDHLVLLPFQGKNYYAFRDYDTVLKLRYGDYMQLPPEEERAWRHHPLLISYEKNYNELIWREKN